MKTKNIILTVTAVAFAALAGCGQQSGVNTPPDSTNSTSGQTMPSTVSDTNMPSTNSMGTNATSNP
ncbi:MAG TPA: hypothetical protein VK742_03690 [Candidatus Sulfotelmatobacter sp.]|jgi:predicted small lipoprotein YifL|nr:hypothetical protein [Candidatus Sulfotelmatobacter sp.]